MCRNQNVFAPNFNFKMFTLSKNNLQMSASFYSKSFSKHKYLLFLPIFRTYNPVFALVLLLQEIESRFVPCLARSISNSSGVLSRRRQGIYFVAEICVIFVILGNFGESRSHSKRRRVRNCEALVGDRIIDKVNLKFG
jgi:hypothetical protein